MPHVGVFESDNPSSDNLRGLVRSGPSSMPHSGVVESDNPRSDNPCGETKFTRKGNAAQTPRRVGQPSLRLLSFPPDMQNDSLQVGDSGGPQVLCEDIDTSRSEILQISAEQVCQAVQAQGGQATEDPEEFATFRFEGPVCDTLRNLGIRGCLEQSCIYREEYAIQCWETRPYGPYAVGVASSQAEAFDRAVAARLQEEASVLRSTLYRMVPKQIRAPPEGVADPSRAIPTSASESQPKTQPRGCEADGRVSNPWNQLQRAHKGLGLSPSENSAMYRQARVKVVQRKDGPQLEPTCTASGESGTGPRARNAWNR